MSMPRSALAATTVGLASAAGSRPPDHADDPVPTKVGEEAQGHLAVPDVVHAQEVDDGSVVVRPALDHRLVRHGSSVTGLESRIAGGEAYEVASSFIGDER
jgi:hypothetical protein